MQRLTEKEYWDSLYNKRGSAKKGRNFLRTICYSERILWDNIYKKYLPKQKGLKILEIGSAPGNALIKFNKRFGYLPFGIDYSEKGVKINKEKFLGQGLNQENIVYGDVFSEEFQNKYKESFDLVYSRGFIEHFSNAEEVIRKHVNLLIPGGTLIVIIPNLRGINRFFQKFFNEGIMSMCNFNIMKKRNFLQLFEQEDLKSLYANYFGTFNFGLFSLKKGPLRNSLYKACGCLQWILNFTLYSLFREKGWECKFFSPYLIFIGKKS